MTQKIIKIYINEIYCEPPKKKYATNKTNVYHIEDKCSYLNLDLKDYAPENNRGYIYLLVVIDNFNKVGWTVPLKKKKARTITDSLENILIISKRKPNLIETDCGREIHNSIFQDFPNKHNKKTLF